MERGDRIGGGGAPREISTAAYRFGPLVEGDGTLFRLWAPSAAAADLLLEDEAPIPMQRANDGFVTARVSGRGPGTRYKFRVNGQDVPDPASRQQAQDSDGWSIVRAPLAASGRSGPVRPWHEAVLCEVHVGTVTPDGTFAALAARLEHFCDAGYTGLELMPVNEFHGARNWGYDGTLLFAPEASYGSPEDLRALVDRAHDLGLIMLLDVVYNHFGNIDNYLATYAPEFFVQGGDTPWGARLDFDRLPVRQFFFENAALWLGEYDFDGLRFDAIHHIGNEAFLRELTAACRAVKPHARLVIENLERQPRWLKRDGGRPVLFDAQWNDEFQHVLHRAVTGEGVGNYSDPGKDPVADLATTLVRGFVEVSDDDSEADADTLPPLSFVAFIQNHDQIGNRPDAGRLAGRLGANQLDFLHFVTLLNPQVPLFFMGEEAHLRTPFPFFIDFPEAVAAVARKDRYVQMRELFKYEVKDGALPDPNALSTFAAARLDWAEFADEPRRAALERFRTLAAWRRRLVWPLTASPFRTAHATRQGNGLIVNWHFDAGTLSMAINPTASPIDIGCLVCGHAVRTGDYSQHGDVLRLASWSALAWSSLS